MDAKAVREAIGAVAKRLVDIKFGTVVSDKVQLDKTRVLLDGDSSGQPVAALGLNSALSAGTRVACISYGSGGLLVIGPTAVAPPLISGAAPFIYGGNSSFTAAQGAPFRTLMIECWAGGGAGGGAPATTAGNSSGGGGGGGGGYARRVIGTSGLVYPLQVNVGAGGSGVSGSTGGAGGNTSVIGNAGAGTILCRALGGAGGGVMANGNTAPAQSAAGAGGSADVGDFGQVGGQGFRAMRLTATQVFLSAGGQGALGGQGGQEVGAGGATGSAGQVYGGGGAGAHATNGNGPFAGGAGAQGLVVITGMP